MKKSLKKSARILALLFVLLFSLTACNTEKLDTKATSQADKDSWMEEQASDGKDDAVKETEKDKEDKKDREDKKDKELTADDDKDFDVDSAKDVKKDYSKYEEKKSTSKTDSVDGVTYSDGGVTDQDQYQTNPIPEGKQNPVEPGDIPIDTNNEMTCYMSISCAKILDNMEELTEGKDVLVPADGVLYSQREVAFYEGESVFDVLQREVQNNRIHMSFRFTPGFNSNYIEAIGNLYEKDCGGLSGWMFNVNGWYPNYGCGRYIVQEGDVIEWNYTCDGGRDLGVDWMQ